MPSFVSITLREDKQKVRFKDTIRYTLTVVNKNHAPIYDVTIKSMLSKFLVLTPSSYILDGQSVADSNEVSLHIGDIEARSQRSISYTATVNTRLKNVVICNMAICEYTKAADDVMTKHVEHSNEVIAVIRTS